MISTDGIKKWLEYGIKKGEKYVVIFCDTFDYSYYPVYSKDEEEFREKMKSPAYENKNMQIMSEIYDLTMDIEKQLSEARAFHPPCGF